MNSGFWLLDSGFWNAFALLGLLLASALLVSPAAADPVARVVGPGGEFSRLSDAIRQAAPGERILVLPGLYREGPILVDRPLEIVGQGHPVIEGHGDHSVITVTSDGVILRGLVVRNAGVSHLTEHAGIRLEEVRDCTVEDNRLEDNFFGIYLARVSRSRIAGNSIHASHTRESTSGNGIHVWHSREVTLRENQVRGHRDGIYLEFVEEAHIERNVAEENLRYGLHFMFSDRSRYEGNLFRRNGAGVAVMYTRRVEMLENRFEENWGSSSYGLLLKDITDSTIRGNVFRKNTVGLFGETASRIELEGNDFIENGWAVRITASSENNHFRLNNFIANTFDVATNSRREGSTTFEENYWSQYTGYDLDRDGIGDVPHRPVRLFAVLAERRPAALILLRSFFLHALEVAERVIPVLTPVSLVDPRPRMKRIT